MPEKFYYGTGRRNINPQIPISLAGYFNVRMWKKILDDIEVRALVLKQAGTYSAIIQFDLVTVSQELAEAFYKEIADIKELSPRNMIVTATHSHTAPEVRVTRPGSHPDYIPFAVKKASEALREALNNMTQGELFTGITEDKRFCFNRRYWMKDGTVVTNPGKLNPDIDRTEGEADYEIPLIGIKSNGKLKVLLANIVNHTDTIGGSNVSADWPGFLMRRLQANLGSGLMVMPLIGASGNINHFDVSTDMDQTCYKEAERVGLGYADTVEKAIGQLKPVGDFTLEVRQKSIACGPREIPDDELAEAKAILEKYKDIPPLGPGADLTSEDLAKKKPVVLKYFAQLVVDMSKETDPVKFNLVGIFMGKCRIVSLPCEPFVEIGLEIKKKIFPEYNTMIVSHSNGTGNLKVGGGYIPNSRNYGRGGYETTPRSNRFSVKTADKLIEAWNLLKK
ncbi:MAG: hypothetical protein A2017_15040 [Lentisphaerae bacterium GWF2_44_16]|nr:MAG: hypothetical protein A2017_15040 [Lentisphaerae bacterium GWF2_44_16]